MPNPQPGQEQMMELCEECGLPIVECNAVAMARKETERWLRDEGYGGIDARKRAAELVPSTRPATDLGQYGELIERLRNAWSVVPAQISLFGIAATALETQAADIARLREALEPLARKADAVDSRDKTWGRTKSGDGYTVAVRLGDCRKARAALSPNPTSP